MHSQNKNSYAFLFQRNLSNLFADSNFRLMLIQ